MKDKAIITTSANGLSQTTQLDVNNDGSYDRTDAVATAVDGSRSETITVLNIGTGALQQKDVITTSADGLTQSLQRDSNGDGTFDHFETTATNADGSVTGTVWDTNTSGGLIDKFVTTTSANGLSKTTTSDVNGDGVVDETETRSRPSMPMAAAPRLSATTMPTALWKIVPLRRRARTVCRRRS